MADVLDTILAQPDATEREAFLARTVRDFQALGMWTCNACGPHVRSRANWCERGCGRDYNQMTWVAEGQTVADLRAEITRLESLISVPRPSAPKESRD